MLLKRPSPTAVLIGVALVIVALPFFWLAGGVRWLDTRVFPARRPRLMPMNSVWIDAPAVPISWHHGWWFGCGVSDIGSSNYCRLVKPNGELVYGNNYVSCRDHLPMAEKNMRLISPPNDVSMWLFGEGDDGVIGFLADGSILLPVSMQGKCNQVKARLTPVSQP